MMTKLNEYLTALCNQWPLWSLEKEPCIHNYQLKTTYPDPLQPPMYIFCANSNNPQWLGIFFSFVKDVKDVFMIFPYRLFWEECSPWP